MKNKLKKGEYRAVVKCSNILEAASNGLISVFPESQMKYDGNWCYFYKNEEEVFDCNPNFASYNFILTHNPQ